MVRRGLAILLLLSFGCASSTSHHLKYQAVLVGGSIADTVSTDRAIHRGAYEAARVPRRLGQKKTAVLSLVLFSALAFVLAELSARKGWKVPALTVAGASSLGQMRAVLINETRCRPPIRPGTCVGGD